MKSQYIHKNKASNNVYFDADICKFACDRLSHHESETCLRGFLQEINQYPFGCIMISDIQVIIYKICFQS